MDMFGKYSETLPILDSGMVSRLQVDKRGRIIVSSGDNNKAGVLTVITVDLDTNAEIVPTWEGHSYAYDDSGNLSSDTVSDGTNTWIRTYTYTPSGPATDSGWVKQ